MTRSERLARENKIEVVVFGECLIAKVITKDEMYKMDLRYVGTDMECLYNGDWAKADIYKPNGLDIHLYAVVC